MNAIPPKYLQFFIDAIARGERDIFCIGGRRSAKTVSTFGFLNILAQRTPLTIATLCAEFQPLQRTIDDFTFSTGLVPHSSTVDGLISRCSNGSKWLFWHLDSKERAQGTKCDILFVNEAVNVSQEVVDTVATGVRLFSVYNLNPTRKVKLLDKSTNTNTLVTTWRDNPYLTDEQRREFEALREKAMSPTATIYDTYMYRVYYRGELAQMVGKVFPPPEHCTHQEFKDIPAKEAIGIDFGFAVDGDPTAVVGVKIFNKKVYAHQYIYQRGITSSEELAHRLVFCGIDKTSLLVGDYGGWGASRMRELRTAEDGKWTGDIAGGFEIYNAIKGKITQDISEVLSLDGLVTTEDSGFLDTELDGYELDSGGTPKGADHAIDALRYAAIFLRRMGA